MPPCHLTDPNVVVIGCSLSSVGRLLGATPVLAVDVLAVDLAPRFAENGPILFDKHAMPNRETTSFDNTYLEHRLSGARPVEPPCAYASETANGFPPSAQRATFLPPSTCMTSSVTSAAASRYMIASATPHTPPILPTRRVYVRMKIPPPASPGLKRWPLERRRRSGAPELLATQPELIHAHFFTPDLFLGGRGAREILVRVRRDLARVDLDCGHVAIRGPCRCSPGRARGGCVPASSHLLRALNAFAG